MYTENIHSGSCHPECLFTNASGGQLNRSESETLSHKQDSFISGYIISRICHKKY